MPNRDLPSSKAAVVRRGRPVLLLYLLVVAALSSLALSAAAFGSDDPRISDEVLAPQVDRVPARPRPILELGDPLLGPGPIRPGIETPTGAVLQPALVLFGELRTAVQAFDDGRTTFSQWVTRLDLFANLQLSGTERVVLGISPLSDGERFTGYNFKPGSADGWDGRFDVDIETLFFEGDLGEMFPGLDRSDTGRFDYGFSVGRQALIAQDGLLIDDIVDSVGVTRNSLMASKTPNLRITGLYAWGDIGRGDTGNDESAHLLGLLTQADVARSTVSVDLAAVYDDGGGDAVYFGIGAVRRIGFYNTTARLVGSFPLHGDSPEASRGLLLFGEVSRALAHSENLLYVDAFWGVDEFSSAARDRDAGGPLGRTGILFEAVRLGNYRAALGSQAERSTGVAIGYQAFYDGMRRQLIFEVGGRAGSGDDGDDSVAAGVRVQQALGRRVVLSVDGYIGVRPDHGLRAEARLKF